MNRAERRKNKKSNINVEDKFKLFDKLPNKCNNCLKAYDKKDKQMAMTWSVVVRDQEEKVNLYCPECWDGAKKMIEQIKADIADKEQLKQLGELRENKNKKTSP